MHILISFLKLLPFLLNIVKMPKLIYQLMADPRVPMKLKLLIPAALIYLISPIDLIRDFIPIIGHFDDILIILLALIFFIGQSSKSIISEASKKNKSKNQKKSVIVNKYKILDDEDEKTGE